MKKLNHARLLMIVILSLVMLVVLAFNFIQVEETMAGTAVAGFFNTVCTTNADCDATKGFLCGLRERVTVCEMAGSNPKGYACMQNDECQSGECKAGQCTAPVTGCTTANQATTCPGRICGRSMLFDAARLRVVPSVNICESSSKITSRRVNYNYEVCLVNAECQSGLCGENKAGYKECTKPYSEEIGSSCAAGKECRSNSCVSGLCAAPTLSTKVCGNGFVEVVGTTPEQCDDWNLVNGDGCSSSCQVEPEPLVFAVNKKYAEDMPDWKERAARAINEVNFVFSKTTDKRYFISEFLVYEDSEFDHTLYNPQFYGNTNMAITLFVHEGESVTVEDTYKISPFQIFNAGMELDIGGRTYRNVRLLQSEISNLLLNKTETPSYENNLGMLLHELGHLNGLGVPEWYFYTYLDCTHTEPLLPSYDLRTIYSEDPMSSAEVSEVSEYTFVELNSKIINLNLNHEYGYMDVNHWFVNKSQVYVTDFNGNPLENAMVKIFCIKKSCLYCTSSCNSESGVVDSNIPEQVLYTNSSGLVTYNGASSEGYGGEYINYYENENTGCLAKAIKVYYGEESKAKYVNFLDLQEDYLSGKETHIDHIVLD